MGILDTLRRQFSQQQANQDGKQPPKSLSSILNPGGGPSITQPAPQQPVVVRPQPKQEDKKQGIQLQPGKGIKGKSKKDKERDARIDEVRQQYPNSIFGTAQKSDEREPTWQTTPRDLPAFARVPIDPGSRQTTTQTSGRTLTYTPSGLANTFGPPTFPGQSTLNRPTPESEVQGTQVKPSNQPSGGGTSTPSTGGTRRPQPKKQTTTGPKSSLSNPSKTTYNPMFPARVPWQALNPDNTGGDTSTGGTNVVPTTTQGGGQQGNGANVTPVPPQGGGTNVVPMIPQGGQGAGVTPGGPQGGGVGVAPSQITENKPQGETGVTPSGATPSYTPPGAVSPTAILPSQSFQNLLTGNPPSQAEFRQDQEAQAQAGYNQNVEQNAQDQVRQQQAKAEALKVQVPQVGGQVTLDGQTLTRRSDGYYTQDGQLDQVATAYFNNAEQSQGAQTRPLGQNDIFTIDGATYRNTSEGIIDVNTGVRNDALTANPPQLDTAGNPVFPPPPSAPKLAEVPNRGTVRPTVGQAVDGTTGGATGGITLAAKPGTKFRVQNGEVFDESGKSMGNYADVYANNKQFAYQEDRQQIMEDLAAAVDAGDKGAIAAAKTRLAELDYNAVLNREKDTKRNWKDFFRGIGFGALKGFASGGLGGAIGGALTGGVVSAFNPDFDDKLQDEMFRIPKAQRAYQQALDQEKAVQASEKAKDERAQREIDYNKKTADAALAQINALPVWIKFKGGNYQLQQEDIKLINQVAKYDTGLKAGDTYGPGTVMYGPDGTLGKIYGTQWVPVNAPSGKTIRFMNKSIQPVTINGIRVYPTGEKAAGMVAYLAGQSQKALERGAQDTAKAEFDFAKEEYKSAKDLLDRLPGFIQGLAKNKELQSAAEALKTQIAGIQKEQDALVALATIDGVLDLSNLEPDQIKRYSKLQDQKANLLADMQTKLGAYEAGKQAWDAILAAAGYTLDVDGYPIAPQLPTRPRLRVPTGGIAVSVAPPAKEEE